MEIVISAEEHGHTLTISFSDNGCGIRPERKEKIFERQIGSRAGMGLFLVREILEITGISILENGITEKGARFEITVPAGAFRWQDMH